MDNTVCIEEIPYRLPSWALPAIINGDVSGLAPHEIHSINDLQREAAELSAQNGASHWHWTPRYYIGIEATNDLPGAAGTLLADTQVVDLVLVYVDRRSTERTLPVTEAR